MSSTQMCNPTAHTGLPGNSKNKKHCKRKKEKKKDAFKSSLPQLYMEGIKLVMVSSPRITHAVFALPGIIRIGIFSLQKVLSQRSLDITIWMLCC